MSVGKKYTKYYKTSIPNKTYMKCDTTEMFDLPLYRMILLARTFPLKQTLSQVPIIAHKGLKII